MALNFCVLNSHKKNNMFSSCLLHSTDEGSEICNKVLVPPRNYKVQYAIINHYTLIINHFARELLQRSGSKLYGS